LHSLKILDTEPEERFDVLAHEIEADLDVPTAFVTLIDADRQWFKSAVGVEVGEIPREMSVCAHAILGDDVMEVPDLLDDPRFADNPAVAGPPYLRFYAGMPLIVADGSRVGTLVVGDQRPRTLTPEERERLREVAARVVAELEAVPVGDDADDA
jgi:GAF domain-containing protein